MKNAKKLIIVAIVIIITVSTLGFLFVGCKEIPPVTIATTTTVETTVATTAAFIEAPAIKLSISDGPTYSATDQAYYYRVKATVTGSPSPTITFSKDDSNGAFGKYIAQVNLTKAAPSYTLTATAKNSAGQAIGIQ